MQFTDKLHNIAFIIEGDSSAITNAICPSLSVNYGCVLTAALSENRLWRFTANQETGFTVEMRMLIEFD